MQQKDCNYNKNCNIKEVALVSYEVISIAASISITHSHISDDNDILANAINWNTVTLNDDTFISSEELDLNSGKKSNWR
jgi:hypothetical protein